MTKTKIVTVKLAFPMAIERILQGLGREGWLLQHAQPLWAASGCDGLETARYLCTLHRVEETAVHYRVENHSGRIPHPERQMDDRAAALAEFGLSCAAALPHNVFNVWDERQQSPLHAASLIFTTAGTPDVARKIHRQAEQIERQLREDLNWDGAPSITNDLPPFQGLVKMIMNYSQRETGPDDSLPGPEATANSLRPWHHRDRVDFLAEAVLWRIHGWRIQRAKGTAPDKPRAESLESEVAQ